MVGDPIIRQPSVTGGVIVPIAGYQRRVTPVSSRQNSEQTQVVHKSHAQVASVPRRESRIGLPDTPLQ